MRPRDDAGRHDAAPPDVRALLRVLAHHRVDHVIVGSVAVAVHGPETDPGDLDVVPALDSGNLQRLAAALVELQATPDGFGHWEPAARGERGWIEEEATPERLAAWSPLADPPASLDHRFRTRHGDLDVLARTAGDPAALARRALRCCLHGVDVLVAHVDDLLAHYTIPRHEKDVPRVRRLRAIQHALALGAQLGDDAAD